MRAATVWLLALVLALPWLGPRHVGAQVDGCPEPNDDLASACPLTSGSAAQSYIELSGDVDLFRLDVPTGGQMDLELGDLPADYDLYLADGNGSLLAQSVHEGTATELLERTVQAGTYFAVVQSDPARAVDSSRPYTIRLTVTASEGTVPLALSTAGSAGRRVLLADNFDDPRTGFLPASSWNPSFFEAGYVDGEYSIKKVDPTESGRGVTLPGSYDDATIAIDARLVGPTPSRRIRLQCRTQPSQDPSKPSSYAFRIFPASREYELIRTDLGQEISIARRQSSPAIQRDNAWNHIELSCIGSRISARVNGQEVASVDDGTYHRGLWNVLLGGPANGTPPAEARFDNLVVFGP